MMKKSIFLILPLVLLGCSYEGKPIGDYLSEPRSIIKDPHFAEYKEHRDALESQHLNKDITYVEYIEKMDELENKYQKEIQERDEIFY